MAKKLQLINSHPRDASLHFDEPTHVYTIDGDNGYKSVTTWIKSFFTESEFNADSVIQNMRKSSRWGPNNKYYGKTNDEIKDGWAKIGKEASELGTRMHLNIEYYYNDIPFTDGFTETKEYQLFMEYAKDHFALVPFRTEWAVYSKKYRIAGTIDMVYNDPNDSTKKIIVDWKRSKDTNYVDKHYDLQLNVYRMILEKYYGVTISEMFLVYLHPNQETYLKIPIQKITSPIMKMLAIRKKELEN